MAMQPYFSSTSRPWLSILVPAYNAEQFVGECIESALRQSEECHIEIIVVDDCSTDGTAEIVDRLQSDHPGLLVLERSTVNLGVSATRNRLLDLASGEYVWFLDSDDRMRPGAVASLKHIVASHAPDLVLCDFSVWRESYTKRQLKKGEMHRTGFSGTARKLLTDKSDLMEGLYRAGQFHFWSKIFRRSLWTEDLKFPEGRHFEDVALSPVIALRAATYYYEPAPWIDYRQSPASILATMRPGKYVELMRALAEVDECMQQYPETLSDNVWFEFRACCGRHFIGCVKDQLRMPSNESRSAAIQACHSFLKAIVRDDLWLARQSLLRGMPGKWIRLKKWEWRAKRAIRRLA